MSKKTKKFKIPEESKLPEESENQNENDLQEEKENNNNNNEKAIAQLKQIKRETLAFADNKVKNDTTKNSANKPSYEEMQILLKKMQEFSRAKLKENKILQDLLKNKKSRQNNSRNQQKNHQKQRYKQVNTQKTSVDKAKEQIKKIEVAYIEYYHDPESKVYSWIPLRYVPPLLKNVKKGELFLMDTPAKFINGKPVYILIKGIPFCIPMNFSINSLYEEMENMSILDQDESGKPKFGRAYLSSMDCYAKYTSIRYQALFNIKKSLIRKLGICIVSFLMGMMTLYIILTPTLFGGG